ISHSWKTGFATQGIARLKAVVNLITLRRSKATIYLPSRRDEVHYLEFSDAEKGVYEATRARTIQRLDNALKMQKTSAYFSVLQWINALRLICNHGVT